MASLSEVNILRTRTYNQSKPLWLLCLFLLSLGLVFVSGDWYVCAIYNECSPPKSAPAQFFEKIYFKPQQAQINLNTNILSAYPILAEISKDGLAKNEELIVEGLYFEGEGADLGLKRAANIATLIKAKGIDVATNLKATFVSSELAVEKYKSFYRGAAFEVVTKPVDNFQIRNQTIYYALNASGAKESQKVLDFLKDVSNRFKEGSLQSINILGHTDNLGNEGANYRLGLKRAQTIGGILVSYGVPENIIKMDSLGESSPAGTNKTFEGRALNRRVELITK